MSVSFYKPDEITACPQCGNPYRDPRYPQCWHCGKCGFAVCEHTKSEIDAIKLKHERGFYVNRFF